MATNESMALYDEVFRRELSNPIFSSKAEISEIIKSLVVKGILEDQVDPLNDKEVEFFIKFGAPQSVRNKRVIKFVSKHLAEKMIYTRLELYEDIFMPK